MPANGLEGNLPGGENQFGDYYNLQTKEVKEVAEGTEKGDSWEGSCRVEMNQLGKCSGVSRKERVLEITRFQPNVWEIFGAINRTGNVKEKTWFLVFCCFFFFLGKRLNGSLRNIQFQEISIHNTHTLMFEYFSGVVFSDQRDLIIYIYNIKERHIEWSQ